jgi:cytochrome P450
MSTIASRGGTAPAHHARAPRGHFLLGVLPQVRRDPLNFFLRVAQEYGQVVPIDLGPQRVFLVNDAALIEHVLQTNAANYQKSKLFKRLAPMLGDGLITSDGEIWRRQRRTSQPAFGGRALAAMQLHMVEATRDLLRRWDAQWVKRAPVDVAAEMNHLALDIALRSLFGIRLDRDDFARVYAAVTEFLRIVDRHIWSPLFVPIGVPTPRNVRYRRAVAEIEDVFTKIIARRRLEPERDDDLLGFLLREYGASPDDERLLRDLVISVLLAAHETTAASLSWTWYLLSTHPAVAERVIDEITDNLVGRDPGLDDLARLPYTRAAYEESLRLYPPIWTFSRDAIGDDRLGDTRIDKGATLMICIYTMQHDPRYWENPEGFDPTRFLSTAEGSRPRYAYFPFGGGPRTCIGARFAVLEAMTVLAIIAQAYRLELVPGQCVEPDPMITLRPRNGIWMKLRESERCAAPTS